MKRFLNLIGAAVFIVFLILISLLPFFLLFLLSDLLCFIFLHVIRYRKKIILKNLRDSFPEKSETEILSILKKSYVNLLDVIVEGIKAFTMSRRQVLKRHHTLNPELALSYLEQGRSVIIVTGHYGNWEWGSLSASATLSFNVVGFYKPLSNRLVNWLAQWSRRRSGTTLASISETALSFEKYHEKPAIFLMAADQNPATTRNCYWIQFLGRETVFLYGPEKYARRYHLPLLYADVQRIKRGFYTVSLSLLTDKAWLLDEGEPTRMYAEKLESVIIARPENWLWSHRRWKHKKPAGLHAS